MCGVISSFRQTLRDLERDSSCRSHRGYSPIRAGVSIVWAYYEVLPSERAVQRMNDCDSATDEGAGRALRRLQSSASEKPYVAMVMVIRPEMGLFENADEQSKAAKGSLAGSPIVSALAGPHRRDCGHRYLEYLADWVRYDL